MNKFNKYIDKKKIDEFKQLRAFYPEPEYSVIKHEDNPDFILKDRNNYVFGVELTKNYDTPTSGRFKNIPNYLEKLINNKFIHKGDKGILKVGEIVKIENNGKENPFPDKGVLRAIPQSPDRIKALKELVTSKNNKYKQYDKSLKAIDLLIYDSGDLIAGLGIQKKQILNYLFKQEQANTLISPFRKIILIIEESSKKVIKILLKSS